MRLSKLIKLCEDQGISLNTEIAIYMECYDQVEPLYIPDENHVLEQDPEGGNPPMILLYSLV